MPISSRDHLFGISAFLKRGFNFLKARYAPRGARISFSGSGEDLIISDLLKEKGISKVSYIDIGAYHPVFGSNTYYFYKHGGHGVLVEPNADMCKKIRDKRSRDICINAGVGKEDGEADFYMFERATRNTFSKDEARAWEKLSGNKALIRKHHIISLNTIIRNHCAGKVPDLVSIDTEGYEVDILSGFNWSRRPKVFCIEVSSSSGNENLGVYELMEEHGYKLVSKTNVNSIFIDANE